MMKITSKQNRWTRMLTVLSSVAVCSQLTYAQTNYVPDASNRVTQLVTDYNGYWSSTDVFNEIRPVDRHNIVGFKFGEVMYSTGVNDALLTANGQVFTPGQFKAFPFASLGGNTAGSYLVAGRQMDGDSIARVVNSYFVRNITLRQALFDGVNGLDISTGVTNITHVANPLTYAFSIANEAVVLDEIPDFLFSQIAEPAPLNMDTLYLVNAEGETVGNPVYMQYGNIPAVGRFQYDFFTYPAAQSYDTAVPLGATASGSEHRDIRLMGVRLSDLGITAENYQEVVGMRITKGGSADPAFYAFNEASINVGLPHITVQPMSQTTCTDGTASVTFSVTATGEDLNYQWKFNNQNIEGATESSYTISPVLPQNAGIYSVLVSNANGETLSAYAMLNAPLNEPIADKNNCLDSVLEISVVNMPGNFNYQWYTNTEQSTEGATPIEGETQTTISILTDEAGVKYYFLRKINADLACSYFDSNVFKVTTQELPVAGTMTYTTSANICAGSTVSMNLAGHSGTIRWQYANIETPDTWLNAGGPGSTQINYTTVVPNSRYYRAMISRPGCASVYTNVLLVTASAVNTWVGGVNSSWNTPANWSCGEVPNQHQAVSIPAGTPFSPISENPTLKSLVIDQDAQMTYSGSLTLAGDLIINGVLNGENGVLNLTNTAEQNLVGTLYIGSLMKSNAGTVNIDGSVYVTSKVEFSNGTLNSNGGLIFGSSATATAYANFTGNSTLNGEVTVERYLSNRATQRLVSTSVTATSIYENWQENGATIAGYGAIITGTGAEAAGFDASAESTPSLFTIDATTNSLAEVNSTLSTDLLPGQGYLLQYTGDRSQAPDPADQINETRLRSTGILNQSDLTYANINPTNGGWSLIGNPYQNKLNVTEAMASSTGINPNYIWVWDTSINEKGAYAIVDLNTNSSTLLTSSASQTINAGEAFMIRTTGENPNLMVSPSHTTNSSSGTQTMNDPSLFRISLFTAGTFTPVDGMLLHIGEEYSDAIDELDAHKIANPEESISVEHGTEQFGIYARSTPEADQRIQLLFENVKDQDYIMLFELNNYMGPQLYLYDNMHNTYTIIEYESFIEITGSPTDLATRFELVFEPEALSTVDFNRNKLRIYPNPVTEQHFTVAVPQGEVGQVHLTNLLGQSVGVTTHWNGSQLEISASHVWSSGVYLLTIEVDQTVYQSKLIVK